jgi:FlaA1/EpsC-like NDP-sugar epimerase
MFSLILFALTVPAMVFVRIFPRLVQDMVHYHERKRTRNPDTHHPRVLVYGAGYGYTLITRAESFEDSTRRTPYTLVGLIDDDPYLKGRLVHGHPVLGTLNDLEALVEKEELDEILVSTVLREENLEKLMHLAQIHNLRVRQSLFSHHVLREIPHPETHPKTDTAQ